MEWLVLLLPFAAFSGWVAARNHYKKRYNNNTAISPEYFKGLNYLLEEQPDKAIDIFIRLLEVNSETVETHMALANLFRRRGETERAIRIHQNLIAMSSLDNAQHNQALVGLGLDYMSAGVLDRAEQFFLELLSRPATPVEAYKQLLRIYQQEKKWQKAIYIAEKLQTQSGDNIGPMIAQFHCEIAEQQLASSPENAEKLLKRVGRYDQNCIRATLLEASIYIHAGHFNQALKSLLQVERQNTQYIPEILPNLLECYQKIGDLPAFNDWLTATLDRHPMMTSVRLMLTHVIQLQYGSKAAQDYLHQELHSHPSAEGLHNLIDLGEQSDSVPVPLIKNIIHTLLQQKKRYTCGQCGFSGKILHWQCPGCKQWSTIRPTEIGYSANTP